MEKNLISLFEWLRSVWQKCKPSVVWWDKRLEKLWEIGKREIKQSRFSFLALATGIFILFVLLAGGSEGIFRRFAILGGAIALVLAGWRSSVATRQEENTRAQIENTKEQIKIAIKGQLSNRFAKAVELTSNNNLSIRLGGLAALKSLAEEDPDEHERVFTYLCSFLRHPPDLKGWANDLKKGTAQRIGDQQIRFGRRPDVDAACQMLRERKTKPGTKRIVLDLNRVCLRGANLLSAGLWGAILIGTNLKSAYLQYALQYAVLRGADLQSAKLQGANFSNALFGSGSSNKGQDLSAVKDLKQLENTFYVKNSLEPILDKSLEGKLDRNIHLVPISGKEWMEQHSPRIKP